ncbi:MAG: hypothetical protein V3U65_19055 [Granulosicoccaceae bacterium]
MMRSLITIALLWQLGFLVAYANTLDSNSTAIDTEALDNKRLFFNEIQRQVDGIGNIKKKPVTPKKDSDGIDGSANQASPTERGSTDMLHYTGVVYSVRGVQLLLNGYPWVPGQLDIVSARLQPDTQLVEIKTANGVLHRLLPGDRVELSP